MKRRPFWTDFQSSDRLTASEWHVTAPLGRRTGLDWLVVHNSRRLPPEDFYEPHPGLATTSPARTLLDLSGTALGDRRLRHVLESQIVAGRPSVPELQACLDRSAHHGVAGTAGLRRLVAELFGNSLVPDSKLEIELSRLLNQADLRGFHRAVSATVV